MRYAILLPILLASANPIVRRHDVDDERYRELGARYADLVVDLNIPRRNDAARRGGNGTGVVIAPHWVLTAAHVAAALRPDHALARVSGAHHLTIGGVEHAVDRVVLHPDWREGGPAADIALIRVEEPIQGGRTAVIYRGGDERGMRITLIGRGDTGTGLTGPAGGEPVLRGATNRIDEVTSHEIIFDFSAPNTPETTELEGVSGPGDSGGPALAEIDGVVHVIGVSVAQDGQGQGPGRYGAREFYTRVSRYSDWISAITAGPNANVPPASNGRS